MEVGQTVRFIKDHRSLDFKKDQLGVIDRILVANPRFIYLVRTNSTLMWVYDNEIQPHDQLSLFDDSAFRVDPKKEEAAT